MKSIMIQRDITNAAVSVIPLIREDSLFTYRVTVDYPEATVPDPIKLWWFVEFDDIFAVWTPGGRFHHELMPSWRPLDTHSRSASGAPVYALYNKAGENRCTFALSDAATPMRLTGGMEERNGKVLCTVELFTNRVDALSHYEVLLRIDTAKKPYYEAIYDTRLWWEALGYPAAPVPADATRTMLSSWYNFQKNITEDALLTQCKMAKALGMDTVIVDDGWQCDETVTGYTYCGDWEAVPSKFPDMRRFVDSLHAIGMTCILWYSVPFIGLYAKNYRRFTGKYLRPKDHNRNVFILDPRFREVRDFLVDTYLTALKTWDLDGFKLDFIDSFSLSDESSTDYEAMDCPSLEDAVARLLDEILTALRTVKPDIMIEFRQSYIGPVMQTYGNILRVGDCAGASLVNRVSSIDLRLLAGDPTRQTATAIHSDMLMWDYDASPEAAADQLAACLFCTPQISVMLERLSPSHTKMLRQYMSFFDKYRHILLHGKLKPLHPEANYTTVTAERDDTVIVGLYADSLYSLPDTAKTVILVNATGDSSLYIECSAPRTAAIKIENCMGEVLEESTESLTGITKFSVPHNGFLYLTA